MRLRDSDIRGLPVFTRSGERVGTVSGVVVDAAHHVVFQYAVSRSRLLSALLPAEFLVGPTQVVSLDAERMTIVDEAVAETQTAAALVRAAEQATSGPATAMDLEG